MYLRINKHTQRGDTIVEVLISVAIVGLVLASSYAVSAQSTRRIQDTQEHSRALQLVQAQIEQLRSHDGIDSGQDCYDVNGSGSATSGPGCQTSGTPQYTLTVSSPDSNGVYQVKAQWDSILGGTAQVTLYYRL